MLYHIYFASVRKNDKAIWHYTIYRDFKYKVYSDGRRISNQEIKEINSYPVCAAINFIIQNCVIDIQTSIRIMTTDNQIFHMINQNSNLSKILLKYWNSTFYKYGKNINAYLIDPLYSYKCFPISPCTLQEKEEKYIMKYSNILN